jgi:hypothetical protein
MNGCNMFKKYLFVVICLVLLIFPVTAYSHHHNEMHKGKEVSICDPHQSICYVCNGQVVNKHYMCIGSYRQLFGQP